MELNLLDVHFDLKHIQPKEIEETLEDPFSVRFLPDAERADGESRYYALGKTLESRGLFLCFSTDGKTYRIIAAREMTEHELNFYERLYASFK